MLKAFFCLTEIPSILPSPSNGYSAQSSVKLSSSYEPGGKRGRPVSSAELIGLEQNNRIVPLHNETVAKWTQTKFVTMLYSSRLEGMDEESTKAWSCTWDSLMKLIEIAFAMAQYDVFLALTVPTIKLLQVSNIKKE